MKLLVILLCLLSERYLIHAMSYLRFNWFPVYCKKIEKSVSQTKLLLQPAILLTILVLPLVVIVGIALSITDNFLFGIFTFLLHLGIFYYCLGPNNPFYPVRLEADTESSDLVVGSYFAHVNGQLFSVIFWYVATGALGVLIYRLISLCREQELTAKLATQLTDLLDWIPARLTVLLFLLVGNFQKGIHFYAQKFILSPQNNEQFLSEGGLLTLRSSENEPVQLPNAESLVEHALVLYLVFLALFTLIALM